MALTQSAGPTLGGSADSDLCHWGIRVLLGEGVEFDSLVSHVDTFLNSAVTWEATMTLPLCYLMALRDIRDRAPAQPGLSPAQNSQDMTSGKALCLDGHRLVAPYMGKGTQGTVPLQP